MITAQHIYDYLACAHRVYLNAREDPAKKRPLAQFLDLLFRRGILHEEKVLKRFTYAVPGGATHPERFQITLALMRRGEPLIYQGVLIAGDLKGIPDLLKKVRIRSDLGRHAYIPIDIKSGKGYASHAGNAVKRTYGIQLAFYARLLQAIQSVYPPQAVVINVDGKEIPFDPSDFKPALDAILPRVRALVGAQETDAPALNPKCGVCGWYDVCLERMQASNDVTLVAGIGRGSKQALDAAGIRNVKDVATLDKRRGKIKGVGPNRSKTWARQAKVYLSGDIEILSRAPIPTAPTRIYFDFEDDPLQDLIYLYGFLTVGCDGTSAYTPIWCDGHQGEKRAFQQFVKLCLSLSGQDYRVYHYHNHEQTVIDRLAAKYPPSDPRSLQKFQSKMVDLERQVQRHVVLPVLNYGLKSVSRFMGFQYQDEDPGGSQSIAWFEQYQKDPAKNGALKQRILTYNREDCEAIRIVHEWLMKVCRNQ